MTIYVVTGRVGFISDQHMRVPDGAKPLTDEQHRALLAQEAAGRVIQWGVYPPTATDAPPTSDEVLAGAARAQRDMLLRTVYDPAVAMLQRAIRMKVTGAAAKLAEFDAWAVALQNVPEQPGFPRTINWPVQPTSEAL